MYMTFGWYFLIGALFLLIPTAYAGLIGAPYVPSRRAIVRKALDQVGIGKDDVVVDLGVGDGSVLIEAAKRGASAYGYELSPIMWAVASVRSLAYQGISIRYGNFYKKNISNATVVFSFLLPKTMQTVEEYLRGQDMPNGKYLLSYAFPLAKEIPMTVIKGEKTLPIYVYDLKQLTRTESTGTQQQ